MRQLDVAPPFPVKQVTRIDADESAGTGSSSGDARLLTMAGGYRKHFGSPLAAQVRQGRVSRPIFARPGHMIFQQ
jgi:hypothetical protein